MNYLKISERIIEPPIKLKNMNINLDFEAFLDDVNKINWIPDEISSYEYVMQPEYITDFRALFGLVPVTYLAIRDMCLKRSQYLKLRKFFNDEKFTQYEESDSHYKFYSLERKILIFGEFDNLPTDSDIDEECEFRIHICPTESNKLFMKKLAKVLKKCFFVKKKHNNNFFMVAQNDRGLYSHETTFKPIPIKDDRYELFYGKEFPHEKLLKFVTEDTENLLLLHGDPGTGKSNYIKHLIYQSKREVIYIPPSMLSVISTPSFISYIMSNAGALLLIEDAEEVLSCDRNSATNNLLGITDGFLKDSLDLKVICTFNCDFGKIDPALIRKGRMYYEYKFDALKEDEVKDLTDFMKINIDIEGPMTLAEIFNAEDNSDKKSLEPRFMGFR